MHVAVQGCTQRYCQQISQTMWRLYNINQVYSAQRMTGKYSVQQ